MRTRVVLTVLIVVAFILADRARADEPDLYRLLVYQLLDLDQRELLDEQSQDLLAELRSWTNLYVEMRTKAKADASADKRSIKTFMLIGWIAQTKNQFATIEAFNTDFMELFEARPHETLQAMAGEDFLLPTLCTYLAKSFFFEKNDPDGRQPWVDRHLGQMNPILGRDRTMRCLESFWRVHS